MAKKIIYSINGEEYTFKIDKNEGVYEVHPRYYIDPKGRSHDLLFVRGQIVDRAASHILCAIDNWNSSNF